MEQLVTEGSRLSGYDMAVIIFYFLFMFSIGFVYRSFSKGSSDYFRGGGKMMWWMVGATAFMTQFSAWTFTGAAGKAYEDGTLVAMIFVGNALGYLVNYLLTSHRFRRMRTVTPIEAVRDRFGPGNEQVFTWMQIPISVLYAGIWLNGLAIVASGYFGLGIEFTIWMVGLAVVFMSVAGGSWAVIASDFVQLLILIAISIVMAVLALSHPAIGGIGGFIEKVPDHHFNWTEAPGASFVIAWAFSAIVLQVFKLNNIFDSYRYLCVKDEQNARKAALLACILMFIGPIIWFIPPMAARIIQPDMASAFPGLNNPNEGAYIFMGFETLPAGMIGLLLCGLFAATMSSMDSGLNRNAGIFVKNFYHPVFRKNASDRELLTTGKISTAVMGLIVILSAINISRIKEFNLFEIMTLFGSLVAIPYAMPLVWGLFYKKTPSWSGWSTIVVGLCFSLYIWGVEKKGLSAGPISLGGLSGRERSDFLYIVGGIGNIVICTAWFFMTSFFWRYSSPEYLARVNGFFKRQDTPVDFDAEEGGANDFTQGRVLGMLCLVYATFIVILALAIPNFMGGRLAFVFCGALIGGVGWALWAVGTRGREKQNREALQDRTDG